MKKAGFLLLTILLTWVTSCQTDDWRNGKGQDPVNGFTLSYSVNGPVSATTRATVSPEEGECDINSFYMLFFEHTANGSGEFIEAIDLSPEEGSTMSTVGQIDIDFGSDSKLNKSTTYSILICANTELYVENFRNFSSLVSSCIGKTENQVIRMFPMKITGVEQNSEEASDNTHQIPSRSLPMSVQVTKEGDQETMEVELIRGVSRFDVINRVNGYRMVSASIWNAYTESVIWDTSFKEYEGERTERFYGVLVTGDEDATKGELYAFENFVLSPEANDDLTTCLILGLVEDGEETPMYYRINIHAENMGQQLKRNNVYKTTISRVLGPGAGSERDAWKDNEFLLDIDINGWTLDNQGNIQYDGDNILAVPVSHLNLHPDGDTRTFNIFTLGEGTLRISRQILDPGITVTLEKNEMTVTATRSDADRKGEVEVEFGNLKANIRITQSMLVTEYLELDVSSLPIFSSTAVDHSGNIKVTSSGSWTAKIYNTGTPVFSFDTNTSQINLSGDNQQTFVVYSIQHNTNASPRYSFVHITLDSNPEISRVLILAQAGIGGITLEPELQSLHFDPDGWIADPVTGAHTHTVSYTVTASDGDQQIGLPWAWNVVSGSAGNFEIVRPDNSEQLLITAALNQSAQPLTTVLRIYLVATPSVFKEITLTQDCHTISFSSGSVSDVSNMGGTSDPVTVTASSAWEATLSAENNTATFADGLTSLSGMNSGESFRVVFPKVLTPRVKPKATVTIRITGTNVTRQFTVEQKAFVARTLYTVTAKSTYGSISSSISVDYISQFKSNMRNVSYFGENGVVYTYPYTQFSHNRTPGTTTDIYCMNDMTPTSTERTTILDWLNESDQHIMLWWGDLQAKHAAEALGLPGYVGKTDNHIPASTARVLNPAVKDHPVMKYLLETGPFSQREGEIPLTGVSLYANDGTNGALSSWNPDMVPLMLDPRGNGNLILGIDPKRRIIFCGDTEIFHAIKNNYVGTTGSYNDRFLNNLLAFITNVALYGDDFLKDFIEE
ncbi:MAG: hypothetical protein LUG98_02995 [Tannerellaceae bacterium]|nr:hypothetical protein [Tannerellaceae bacterium]